MGDRPSLLVVFAYLDVLRESGATNMWGAGPYVERKFGLADADDRSLVGKWMDTFDGETALAERVSRASQVSA